MLPNSIHKVLEKAKLIYGENIRTVENKSEGKGETDQEKHKVSLGDTGNILHFVKVTHLRFVHFSVYELLLEE